VSRPASLPASGALPPRRAIALAASVLLAFLVGALVWFPAALAARALPPPYACAAPSGSLWRGRCDDLRVGDASVGALSWTLRALPLLVGRVSADLTWARSGSRLEGRIDATASAVEVRDLRGDAGLATLRALPLWSPSLLNAWSPGEGRLRIDLKHVGVQGRRVARIEGRIDLDGLVSIGRERWVLGDYRLDWRDGPTPVGRLTDRGGPLELDAAIAAATVTDAAAAPPGGAWGLEGKVRARNPDWRPRLMVFGPADSAGWHRVSVDWR
jgi:hypothetical protein